MKKHLLLSAIALASMIGTASASDYIARELDGRMVRITNNVHKSSHITTSGDHLATTLSTAPDQTIWQAEYDAIEDGIILSQNGKYMGCIPTTVSAEISWTDSKDNAGRYRFYTFDEGATYCLTTTKLADGSDNIHIGVNGGANGDGGYWAQSDLDEGHIVRWGSWHNAAHWLYSFADEMEIEITIGENGTGKLQNYYSGVYRNQDTWNARWIANDAPHVILEVASHANNMQPAGENDTNLGLAPGNGGCDYIMYINNPTTYRIQKVEFDFHTASASPTIVINGETLTASPEEQHFEMTVAEGETVSFHANGSTAAGTNVPIIFTNFKVTLRKLPKEQILPDIQTITETTKELYSHYPTIWNANVIDEVANEMLQQNSDFIPEDIFEQLQNRIIKAVNATANGKLVSFRNLMHHTRYINVGEHKDGSSRAHTTDDPHDLTAVWTLIYDETTNGFRISNFLTEQEIGLVTNDENPITLSDKGNGHIYAVNPLRAHYVSEDYTDTDHYVVDLWDRQATGHNYLHCGGQNTNQIPAGGQRVVRWNSAASASASGWFIDEVIFENQLDAIKHLEGQDIVITKHVDGHPTSYLTVATGAETTSEANALRPGAIWRITVSDINKRNSTATIALQNLITGQYTNDLTSLSATSATTLKIDDVPEFLETWHIFNTAASTTDPLGTYTIQAITDEMKAAMVNDLHSLYYNQTPSDEPGLMSFNNDALTETYLANKTIATTIIPEADIDYATLVPLFDFMDNHPLSIFNLNGIQGPALIQMAYIGDKNLNTNWDGNNRLADHNATDGSLAFDATGATFVLADRKLHSLNTGRGIINGGNKPSIHTGDDLEGNLDALIINFGGTQRTSTANIPDGSSRLCYSVREEGTNNTFGGSSRNYYRVGDFGNQPEPTPSNWSYLVWYVKELPITVKADGQQYKLWRTPVAVAYEGTEPAPAYTVAVDNINIITTPVEEGTIYGAGTTFILTDDLTFTVKNGLDVEAQTVGLGHHALQNHTMTASNIYLSIHPDAHAAAPAAAPGRRITNREGLPTLKMQIVAPEADTPTALGANEAIIAVAKTENHNDIISRGSLDLVLGDSTDTTSGTTDIAEINLDAPAGSADIFDLQGRRLAAPVKGINIINGKKILCR